MLPESLNKPLQDHLYQVKVLHKRDPWPRAGAACFCPMPLTVNNPMPRRNGVGNGCSHKKTGGTARKPAKRDAIMSVILSVKRRFGRQSRRQD